MEFHLEHPSLSNDFNEKLLKSADVNFKTGGDIFKTRDFIQDQLLSLAHEKKTLIPKIGIEIKKIGQDFIVKGDTYFDNLLLQGIFVLEASHKPLYVIEDDQVYIEASNQFFKAPIPLTILNTSIARYRVKDSDYLSKFNTVMKEKYKEYVRAL
jgi:hypothetical protein